VHLRRNYFLREWISIYLILKYCKKHKLYDTLILADAKYLPFRVGAFDIIIALELIEHLTKK